MILSLSLVSSAEPAEIIIFSLGSVFLDAGGSNPSSRPESSAQQLSCLYCCELIKHQKFRTSASSLEKQQKADGGLVGTGGPFVCLFRSSVLAPDLCWTTDMISESYSSTSPTVPRCFSVSVTYF